MATFWNIRPQIGGLGFAAVTATTAGTANAVVTADSERRIVVVTNALNTPVMLTYDGSAFVELQASNGLVIDLGQNSLCLNVDKVIGVYHLGAAPSSGRLSVTLL